VSYGKIFKLDLEDNLGIVTFDVPGEPMNTWTEEALNEFFSLLDDLESKVDLRGLIFVSGKKGNYHSGANLKFIGSIESREKLSAMLDKTHQAFNRLGRAPFVSLAAINGHCLGGGYEFALACSVRMAQESKTTMIGLPETSLGLFPGGGGTQRLSRLIGPAAIDLILSGKVLPPQKAKEFGMVDKIIDADADLIEESKKYIKNIIEGKEKPERIAHDFSAIDAHAEEARKQVLKSSRGRELPGPLTAIKAIQEGVKLSLEEGLEKEKNYFTDVAFSKEARGSIHTFFLKTETEKPVAKASPDFKPKSLNKVALLGFGFMGRGIAIELLRRTQLSVVVKDTPEMIEKGTGFVKKMLEDMASKNKLQNSPEELINRLIPISEYNEQLKDADLVIEAVYEDKKVKKEVYGELSSLLNDDCIIVSNTSTIPIDQMAPNVSNPDRFAGLHFFSPVWKMQLVEVVKGAETSLETIANLFNFVGQIKKRPIKCNDNPGFVVNALLLPYFLKMYDLLDQGVPIENIDRAMVKFGLPVGPMRLIDEMGIDVHYYAFLALGVEPPDIVKRAIADERYGFKKSGKGYFLEDGSVDPGVIPLINPSDFKKAMDLEEIQNILYKTFVEKGKELLEQGVVDSPKAIDVGMIWGVGFPPEKGGPMKWADLTGLSYQVKGSLFYG